MDLNLWKYIFEMFNYKIRQKKSIFSKLQTLTPPLMPWTSLDDIQFTFDELILLRFLNNYYVPWRWTIDILHLWIISDETPRGLTFHALRPAMDKWLWLWVFLRPALLIGNHRQLLYMTSALGFSWSYTRIEYRIVLYSIRIWRYLTVWCFDSLSNHGFVILIMINNIWRTFTIMDNLTTYKYNRNFDSFVTLEESVELWRRGKISKIYFRLHSKLEMNTRKLEKPL